MNANEHLLSKIVKLVEEECKGLNVKNLQIKLSELLSGFNVKIYEINNENNEELQDKIEMFLSAKKLEGASQLTIDNYKLELGIFANRINKDTKDITTADIRVYLNDFSYLKNSSLMKKLSVLKSFFGWLTNEELIEKNPTAKLKPPKKERIMPKFLTIEELEMMREGCKTLRQRALIEVLYATGCRLSEVQRINKIDINFNTNSAKVIGKGNIEREVFFSFRAIYHLKRYLENREDNETALFITERKPYRRLGKRQIQKEITKIAKQAGIEKEVSPHTLRHTFASLTLNNGADISTIQAMLGHSSPATTQVYAQVTDEYKRAQHKKFLIQ